MDDKLLDQLMIGQNHWTDFFLLALMNLKDDKGTMVRLSKHDQISLLSHVIDTLNKIDDFNAVIEPLRL